MLLIKCEIILKVYSFDLVAGMGDLVVEVGEGVGENMIKFYTD